MIKKIKLIFSLFIYLIFSIVFFNSASANSEIDVYAKIKDEKWLTYNYLFIYINKWNSNVCQWMTRQYYDDIEIFKEKWINIKKVNENWIAKFKCNKNDLIDKNGRLYKDINVSIKTDGFYNIYGWSIDIDLTKNTLTENTLIIWNFAQSNFPIILKNEKNILFNRYDKEIDNKIKKVEEQIERKEKLDNISKNIRSVKLKIKNIPVDVDIKDINISINWVLHPYKQDWIEIQESEDSIKNIFIWKKFYKEIPIIKNIAEVLFNDDILEKENIVKINIKDIPDIKQSIYFYIDDDRYLYKEWISVNLTKKQRLEWFNLKIGNNTYKNLKISNTGEISVSYNKIVDNIFNEKNLDKDFIHIKIPKIELDSINRFTFKWYFPNWWNKRYIISRNNVFIDWNNTYITNIFKKTDIIPEYIVSEKTLNKYYIENILIK